MVDLICSELESQVRKRNPVRLLGKRVGAKPIRIKARTAVFVWMDTMPDYTRGMGRNRWSSRSSGFQKLMSNIPSQKLGCQTGKSEQRERIVPRLPRYGTQDQK